MSDDPMQISRVPQRSSTMAAPQLGHEVVLARTAVSLEYASLRHTGHCPLGMYILPSSQNVLIWDGVFFVHQGACL